MNQYLNVVGAIFIQNGRIFAAKRGDSKYPYVAHKYEFVGGKTEAGESPEAALKRELLEEMHLEIEVVRRYAVVQHEYPDFCIRLDTYLCNMLGDWQLTEHEEATWLPIADLRSDEWAPADAPIIRKIQQDKEWQSL